jgi:hypothetical protein
MVMGKIGIASWPFWLKTRTRIEKTRPTPPLIAVRQLPLGGPCKGRVREASRVSTTLDLRDVANFTRRGSIITGESMKENPNWSKKLVGHSHRLSATAQSEGRRDAEASADLWPAPRALFPPQSAVRVRSYKPHRDIAVTSTSGSKRLK